MFVFKVALGLVAFAWKPWLGWLFLAAYGLYVWRELRSEGHADDEVREEGREALKLRPDTDHPSTAWAVVQTVGALVVIYFASQLFVHQLEAVGPWLGMSPQLVALPLSPIATELPEIHNAVIWVRQGKTALALGNISGADDDSSDGAQCAGAVLHTAGAGGAAAVGRGDHDGGNRRDASAAARQCVDGEAVVRDGGVVCGVRDWRRAWLSLKPLRWPVRRRPPRKSAVDHSHRPADAVVLTPAAI